MGEMREFEEAATLIMIKSPFVGSILYKLRVLKTTKLTEIAGVDKYGNLYINEERFKKLSLESRAFVVGHETLHAVFKHAFRGGRVESKELFNIAADIIVNEALIDNDFRHRDDLHPLRAHHVSSLIEKSEDEIKRWSVERLYRELLKHAIPYGGSGRSRPCPNGSGGESTSSGGAGENEKKEGGNGSPPTGSTSTGSEHGKPCGESTRGSGEEWKRLGEERDLTDDFVGEQEGEVIREGDSSLYEGSENELEERWKEVLENAQLAAKMAGREPLGAMLAEINSILKPKVDWRALLRTAISVGLQKHISTWKRLSRKSDDFPGFQRYGLREVYAIVDTSGSISERELEQFLGEIYGAAKCAKVLVRCFDADVYEKLEVKRPSDAKTIAKKMRGGGGTRITPALKKTLQEMRSGSIVVVMTDGHLFDEEEAKPLFTAIATRGKGVIVTTDKTVDAPGWTQISLSL
ncbi:hypothetical protein DRJ19_02135 [Candidatus Woesearchaeota archaeon]|nr:MAG: hypothetical protein DRJ19_02135 [Candidatus Woesearchaeota archaeon]